MKNYYSCSPKGGTLPLGRLGGMVSAPHMPSCKQPMDKSGKQKETVEIDQNDGEEEIDDNTNDLDGSN